MYREISWYIKSCKIMQICVYIYIYIYGSIRFYKYRRLVIWYTNPKEFTPPGVPRIVPWHRPKAPIGSSSTTASDGSAIGK